MGTRRRSIPRCNPGVRVESGGAAPVAGFDADAIVELLSGFDPSGLDGDSLLRVMAESEQLLAAAHAVQVRAVIELSRIRPYTSERRR